MPGLFKVLLDVHLFIRQTPIPGLMELKIFQRQTNNKYSKPVSYAIH